MTPNKELSINPITAFLLLVCFAGSAAFFLWGHPYVAYVGVAVAVFIGLSLKMANVWQKFVILRMGKLQSVRGAGLFGGPLIFGAITYGRISR
jgi:hypothetical protein